MYSHFMSDWFFIAPLRSTNLLYVKHFEILISERKVMMMMTIIVGSYKTNQHQAFINICVIRCYISESQILC